MTGASPEWRIFPSPDALAEALAVRVAEQLRSAVAERGEALLAVSGGSTPAKFLEALSREQLDWTKVVVTLVDERFAPPTSDRSNERLVREKLLRNEARLARFVGLYSDAATVEDAARAADAGMALLPRPLDAVVLGMGLDGHTASFFPDAHNLQALLDPAQVRVQPVHAQSAGEPRLTLPLSMLVSARLLVLHIEGDAKRRVLEAALGETVTPPPIAKVLEASAGPVQIVWTP